MLGTIEISILIGFLTLDGFIIAFLRSTSKINKRLDGVIDMVMQMRTEMREGYDKLCTEMRKGYDKSCTESHSGFRETRKDLHNIDNRLSRLEGFTHGR